MMTSDEYRSCAADCVVWANESATEALRQALLQMAREYIELAQQVESSKASMVEPVA